MKADSEASIVAKYLDAAASIARLRSGVTIGSGNAFHSPTSVCRFPDQQYAYALATGELSTAQSTRSGSPATIGRKITKLLDIAVPSVSSKALSRHGPRLTGL